MLEKWGFPAIGAARAPRGPCEMPDGEGRHEIVTMEGVKKAPYHGPVEPLNRTRLADLTARERNRYRERNPNSAALHERADHLVARVPMTWMTMWAGGFPLGFASARGASITDLDGHDLADFALGDTGAMAGHSPEPLVAALADRAGRLGGVTTMLPNEDAEWVGAELTRRFGLAQWSFTLSATDANRWLLRLVRLVTGRPKVLVFSYCYHGSVDETFVVLDEHGRARSRPGNVAPAVDPATTTRVVEFNDLAALERELSYGDVAAVLTEPALTNIGIVLAEPGFFDGVRALCDASGTLLILDETHTFSAGPGGATKRFGLRPRRADHRQVPRRRRALRRLRAERPAGRATRRRPPGRRGHRGRGRGGWHARGQRAQPGGDARGAR